MRSDLLKVNFFAQANFLTEHFLPRNWLEMPYKHVKILRFFKNCAIFFKLPVFPILCSTVHLLRRFLKILRRRASARLRILKALIEITFKAVV